MAETLAFPHKKSRARKAEPEIDPEFQIAPMIDILLVLLVFFMSISTTEILQSSENVRLAVAKDASKSKKNPGQTIVNITYIATSNVAGIEIDERKYTVNDLTPMLQAKVRANPQMRVLIRCDRSVPWSYERTVLETIAKANIGNITFSAASKEEDTK